MDLCLPVVLLDSSSAGAFAPADVNTLAPTTTATTGTKAQTNEVWALWFPELAKLQEGSTSCQGRASVSIISFPPCNGLEERNGSGELGIVFGSMYREGFIGKCFDSSHFHNSWSWSYFSMWFWQAFVCFCVLWSGPSRLPKTWCLISIPLVLRRILELQTSRKPTASSLWHLCLQPYAGPKNPYDFVCLYMSIYVYIYIHPAPYCT